MIVHTINNYGYGIESEDEDKPTYYIANSYPHDGTKVVVHENGDNVFLCTDYNEAMAYIAGALGEVLPEGLYNMPLPKT